ncbi:hypothetical protein RIR_jg4649.t1 [Rhizophagus irregularis DAOM 181602=DAOM 197198]|nr:hypothetical protein RIR_jg4649.t1 [Rhizophagus irregularis DAOM 181602=DAOM 197198]
MLHDDYPTYNLNEFTILKFKRQFYYAVQCFEDPSGTDPVIENKGNEIQPQTLCGNYCGVKKKTCSYQEDKENLNHTMSFSILFAFERKNSFIQTMRRQKSINEKHYLKNENKI